MKRHVKALAVLCLLGSFALTGCGGGKPTESGGGTNSPSSPSASSSPSSESAEKVVVAAVTESVSIKESEAADYDFASLFTITVDGEEAEVLSSYVDSSSVSAAPGTYTVTCSYKGESASVLVTVSETVYGLVLSVEEVTVKLSLCLTYDYKALFSASVDGAPAEITDAMIESAVIAEVGEYAYKVTFHGITRTLTVRVVSEHEMEAVVAYRNLEIPIGEISGFDYTRLFSLYVDGEAVRVTPEMIDASSVADPVAGGTYEILFAYARDGVSCRASASVKAVEESRLVVNTKNVVTYPNGEYIDLTSLFEIRKGGESIPVESAMISGTIDYSSVGVNEITLSYEGKSYVATVEVKRGVIVGFAAGDTVVIRKGTDLASYSFANDFRLLINGIRFKDIPEKYFDTKNVDFDTVGEYRVKLSLPYNDEEMGLWGPDFTYAEETITYVVKENNYSVSLGEETVTLPKGTTDYNVYGNLSVTINGKKQALTENAEYVDAISCYVQTLSAPVDFTAVGLQEVRVAVYVDGPDNPPVVVSYHVIMQSDLVVTAQDAAVFAGTTFYTKDLFTVCDGETEIEVTYDMITGKVDTFTPGVYEVYIEYLGIVKTSTVVVFDAAIAGTYHTGQTTIPPPVSTDEDADDTAERPVYPLGDLVISTDGTMSVNGAEATILGGIDAHTMRVRLHSSTYTLYYENGIVALDPDNELRLRFNEYRRPLLYFHEAAWTLQDAVTINYSTVHVLELTTLAYSIDTFQIQSTSDGTTLWYGLLVDLVEKGSSDTIYKVSWGEVVYADDFLREPGAKSSLTYGGNNYSFTMQSQSVGKVAKDAPENRYANTTFKGVVDGKEAQLSADQYEGFTLVVDKKTVFSVGSYEIGSMKNGGVDYDAGTVFLYACEDDANIYSYKFLVDAENRTFTLLDKDSYYGKYKTDGMYVFLDGYGTGYINFNTTSHVRTQLSYLVNGNEAEIVYVDAKPSFAYGSFAKFYLDPLLNVLTVKYMEGDVPAGTRFENSILTDGALVHISSYAFGADATLAKKQFYAAVEIVTGDGVLDDNAKEKCIDATKIDFATPGFYQFTVTVSVNGKNVVSYYALQILEKLYENNPVVATYGSGVIYPANHLSLDVYGRAIVDCGGVRYTGFVTILPDNSFVVKATNDTYAYISLTGTYVAPGLVLVRCAGAVSFTDYFTTGSCRTSGAAGFVLREFGVGGGSTYILSPSASSVGEIVTVEAQEGTNPAQPGAILKISTGTGEVTYVKILDWNDPKGGLEILENYGNNPA